MPIVLFGINLINRTAPLGLLNGIFKNAPQIDIQHHKPSDSVVLGRCRLRPAITDPF
jgi:hypothetical protein